VTLTLSATPAGIVLAVKVVARAGRTEIAGVRGDALLVRLAAAPVDGAANDALTQLLASVFHLARRDVTIVSGHGSRTKRIAIARLSLAEVRTRLDAILSA
jgi:uncharacterized protein (TIGR00251 family)